MTRKTRKEKAIEMMEARLSELDSFLLDKLADDSDEKFEAVVREAIQLREMLKILKNSEL
jgi:hypothetical protein